MNCPSGSFSDAESENCGICGAGIECRDANQRDKPCLPGEFSPEGYLECRKCPLGTFSPERAGNCTTCPAGMDCTNYPAVPCAPGRFSPAGELGCRLCDEGENDVDLELVMFLRS